MLRMIGLTAAVGLLLASPAGAQAPAGDAVTGTGNVTAETCFELPGDPPFVQCFSPDRYVFDVHSGPEGQAPRGTVTFAVGERQGLQLDNGTVTCLTVSGDRAAIGVDFDGLAPPFPPQPHSAIVFVADLGGPGDDLIGVQDLPAGTFAPSSCPAAPPAGLVLQPTFPRRSTTEDVVVTDAAPPGPASKEQCKKGGFAAFGFRNQGQCVASVRRGPER